MDLDKMRCKLCKHWRKLYIHPWSEGIPDELKGKHDGFACVLPLEEEFIGSFNGHEVNKREDLQVDIMIGKDDSLGCECFSEVNVTNRELAKWITLSSGQVKYDGKVSTFYSYREGRDSDEVPDGVLIRAWDSRGWVSPTKSVINGGEDYE